MPLESGIYTITSMRENLLVGVEPLPIPVPKKVFVLPRSDGQPPFTHWRFEKKDDGNVYELSVGGASAAKLGEYVYAVPNDDGEEKQWRVEHQPTHGGDVYTIVLHHANHGQGWMLRDDNEGAQVSVQPLIVFPSYPPRYPSHELFKIVPVDD